MIKTQVDLRNHNIIGRERAALIASPLLVFSPPLPWSATASCSTSKA